MSHYSQTNILNKLYIFVRVLKDYKCNWGLSRASEVYVLVTLRALTGKGLCISLFTVCYFNSANCKNSSLPTIRDILLGLSLLGYVTISKSGKYKITLAGLACLDELEVILKRSVFKKKRSDSNSLTKPPGRKKGVVYAADINKRK